MKLFDSVQGNLINTRPKRFQGRFSRVGVFPYIIGKQLYWQYRPADEVFSEASVESFYDVNLTISHPEGNNDDDPEYCHGAVVSVEPKPDEGCIDGTFMVMTDEAFRKAKDQSPLSPMYDVLLKEQSGVFEGRKYDLVQTNIRYTSLGLVDAARQGDGIKVFFQISKDSLTLADPKAKDQQLLVVPNITADLANELSPEIIAMGQPIGATHHRGSAKTPISIVRELNKKQLNATGNGNVMSSTAVRVGDADEDQNLIDPVTAETVENEQANPPEDQGIVDPVTAETVAEEKAELVAEDAENIETAEPANEPVVDPQPPEPKNEAVVTAPVAVPDGTNIETAEVETTEPATEPAAQAPETEVPAQNPPLETINPNAEAAPTAQAPEAIAPQPVKAKDSTPVAEINSVGGVNVQRDYLDTSIMVAQDAASKGIMGFEDALHVALSSSSVLKSRILAKAGVKLSDWDDVDMAYKIYSQLNPPTLSAQTIPASNGDSAIAPATVPVKAAAPAPISIPAATSNRDSATPSVSHPKHGNLSGNAAPPVNSSSGGGSGVFTFEDLE